MAKRDPRRKKSASNGHVDKLLLADEQVINTYLQQMGKLERLAPEEEAFHTRRFFEARESVGRLLSRFPRFFVKQIRSSKTTQIQEFDEDGNLNTALIDEKKERILSLISSIETVADHLVRCASDASDEAVSTRNALFGSLEQLQTRFLFHYAFYTESLQQLRECREQLAEEKNKTDFEAEVLLMPVAAFTDLLEEVEAAYSEMDSARTTLLESNLRLVANVTRRYMRYGMNFQDLFQEGYLGVAVALDKFQPSRGHRFSTYAVWWIRQSITQALSAHSRTIRIPANMARFLSQMRRAEQQLLQSLGREPTPEEIARKIEQSPERVRAWQRIERQPISLESPLSSGDGSVVSDLIVDAGSRQPDEVVSSNLLKEAITSALDTLDEREQTILEHRFGLLGKSVMTLEELSKRFNVSHERIRQIEVAALKKLKSPERRKYFDGYY